MGEHALYLSYNFEDHYLSKSKPVQLCCVVRILFRNATTFQLNKKNFIILQLSSHTPLLSCFLFCFGFTVEFGEELHINRAIILQKIEMAQSTSLKCKIVILGDQSVGKTSIISRFIFDNFTGNEQPTVGVDFLSKTVTVENKNVRMQLWDTAGQQRFYSLIPSYLKDCNAAIVVFDITSSASFNNLSKWIDCIREVRGEQALIFAIGNKSDLEQQREVQAATAAEHLKQQGISYMEVSAKSSHNIKQFFKDLAYTIGGCKKEEKSPSKPPAPTNQYTQPISLNNYQSQQSQPAQKKCC